MSALLAAALLFQVQNLRNVDRACPFFVVTVTGDRVGSLDRPNRDGKPLRFRDCTTGTLTLLPASEVDWAATEKVNGAPTPVPTPILVPTPTPQILSGIANKMLVRDAAGLVKQNEGGGKMKTASGAEIEVEGTNYFGKDSVAEYLELGTFLANTGTCPGSRAVAYGVVKNVSSMKLRDLRAYVVIGSLRTGQHNGQIQTMDPSNLMPGEEAKIFLYLSCDFATRGGYGSSSYGYSRDSSIVVILADVSGRTEAFERPGASSFDAGSAGRAAPPTPTAGTARPR